MFGDVADAADELVPGEQRQQPQHGIEPPVTHGGQPGEQHKVGQQPAGDAGRIEPRAAFMPCVALPAPGLAPLLLAPLPAGLAGEVAAHLAPQAVAGDRKRRRQHQIGVVGLLGEAVVFQVIGAIELQIGAHRPGAEPLAGELVPAPGAEQQAMGGIMHQDGEAELAPADHHHGEDEAERVGPGGKQRHGAEHQPPGMQHQQRAHEVGPPAEPRQLRRREDVAGGDGLRLILCGLAGGCGLAHRFPPGCWLRPVYPAAEPAPARFADTGAPAPWTLRSGRRVTVFFKRHGRA